LAKALRMRLSHAMRTGLWQVVAIEGAIEGDDGDGVGDGDGNG